MKIVVTTPTGHVGSRVARLLTQAGVRPVVLARDPGRLPEELRERVEAVACDQGDAEAVVRATAGADALFWVDPPTGDEDPAAGYARMGANGALAVRENRIGRTVFLSSGGAEFRSGAGEIDGLGRTEELLEEAAAGHGGAVLHLRCGYFYTNLFGMLDDLRAGVLRSTLPVDHALPWVDPRDIGDVAAARLLSRGWEGVSSQGVHGPEDLSFADAARVVGRATGREVRAEQISEDALREVLRGAGLGDKQVEDVVGMTSWMLEGRVPHDSRSPLTTTPTTLAAWAHENLRSAL
ncbi:NAD(P)H-binding protein [Streptomyces sp. NPDC048172]|uniref:NmrA family NAD(P)-binding protein n=1 Tax=Streptomyces sp. NPDC048172 TaxID=3365505 RepID=UPI00371F922D